MLRKLEGIWCSRKSTRFRECYYPGVLAALTMHIRIHVYNLLSLAFLAVPESPKAAAQSSALAFLYVTSDYTIELGIKVFDQDTHEYKDLCPAIDVLSPPSTYALPAGTNSPGTRPDPSALQDDFACPGAAKLLALPPPTDNLDDTRLGGVLVIGDEFSSAYTLRKEKNRTSSTSAAAPSSLSGESRTSPENTKRRKGSAGGSLVPVVGAGKAGVDGAAGKIVLARQWRVRQGFGEVSGYV